VKVRKCRNVFASSILCKTAAAVFGRKLRAAVRTAWGILAVLSAGCADSIHDAALKGDVSTARRMLDARPDLVSSRNRLGKTPLHQSLTGGNNAILDLLIERGAEVNAQDNTGLTPLHVAAWWSITERAGILLDHGADIGARDRFGDTPLHIAAMNGRGKMCKFLIERGADIHAKNLDGREPLDLARLHHQDESVRVLEYFIAHPTAVETK
jgi:cytohesin